MLEPGWEFIKTLQIFSRSISLKSNGLMNEQDGFPKRAINFCKTAIPSFYRSQILNGVKSPMSRTTYSIL